MQVSFVSKYRIFILSIILTVILVFLKIDNKSLYLDEAASVAITDNLYSLPAKLWFHEGNSWLFYILFFFWSRVSISEIWIRTFAAIWGILTIFPLYYLAKKLFNNKTADLTVLLLPLNVFFIKTSQFARGYSLLLFLIILSSLIFVYLLNKSSRFKLFLYLSINVLAIYTHLFALLVVVSHFIYLYIVKKKISLINYHITYFGIFLSAVPIFVSPAMRSGQIDWISKPGLFSLGSTFVLLTGDFLPISFLLLLLITAVIYFNKIQTLKNSGIIFLLISILFPISVTFTFFVLFKPIYNLQYLIIVLPSVLIFTAYIFTFIKNRWFIWTILVILFVSSIMRLYFWYASINESGFRLFTLDNNYPEWKQAVKYLENNYKDKDKVIVIPAYTHISFDYYNNRASRAQFEQITLQPNSLDTGVYHTLDLNQLKTLPQNTKRVWFIKNPRGNTIVYENAVLSYLNQNYKLIKNKYFYQVSIGIYEKR